MDRTTHNIRSRGGGSGYHHFGVAVQECLQYLWVAKSEGSWSKGESERDTCAIWKIYYLCLSGVDFVK